MKSVERKISNKPWNIEILVETKKENGGSDKLYPIPNPMLTLIFLYQLMIIWVRIGRCKKCTSNRIFDYRMSLRVIPAVPPPPVFP